MEITKDNSTPEYPHIYFSGEFDCCALALNTQSTWLRFFIGSTLDEHVLLSQEDVKTLLPYLQTFAESGTLDPLQGGDKGKAERASELAFDHEIFKRTAQLLGEEDHEQPE